MLHTLEPDVPEFRVRQSIVNKLLMGVDTEDMVNCLSAFEKELADVARKVMKATLKPGTISNYESVIKDFKQFLQ